MHYESKNSVAKKTSTSMKTLHYTYHMKNLMSIPYIYIIQYICLCMSCCKAAVDVIECLFRDQTLPVWIWKYVITITMGLCLSNITPPTPRELAYLRHWFPSPKLQSHTHTPPFLFRLFNKIGLLCILYRVFILAQRHIYNTYTPSF